MIAQYNGEITVVLPGQDIQAGKQSVLSDL
jgi:hypothetical protein